MGVGSVRKPLLLVVPSSYLTLATVTMTMTMVMDWIKMRRGGTPGLGGRGLENQIAVAPRLRVARRVAGKQKERAGEGALNSVVRRFRARKEA